MNQEQQIVSAYVKLLKELGDLRVSDPPPELILPVPKDELRQIVVRSEHPAKNVLIEALEQFKPEGRYTQLFRAELMRPSFAAVAAAVAIIIGGGSWLWLVGAFLGAVGAFFASLKMEDWAKTGQASQWGNVVFVKFAEMVFVVCWGALWLRLVITSGLYDLYLSTWVRFSAGGVILAVLSLCIGYFFAKYLKRCFSSLSTTRGGENSEVPHSLKSSARYADLTETMDSGYNA